jgi:hypothetical protein
MMEKVYKYSLSGLLMIITLISCEYEKRDPFDPGSIPEEISYIEHVQPIFGKKCTGCHPGVSPPDLSPDNSYFDLTSGNYLDLENPENSYIYKKISGSGSMEIYADDYDRAVILRWIEQGAQDN